ncbi:hypothetical protein B9479_000573 [Cryptococcus floricola]|uniref:GPI inositol-deacylase n=1 Tax=Cryptococcus floricola TaxID=2591691 RepID=A0A5D3B4U6_9TREE|nr:hypothetical protein B9479_000573 [Cryptococcus floricola]
MPTLRHSLPLRLRRMPAPRTPPAPTHSPSHHHRRQSHGQEAHNVLDAAPIQNNKGKGRAEPLDIDLEGDHGEGQPRSSGPMSVLLDEALHTSLSPPSSSLASSLESTSPFAKDAHSPIPEPPQAHYPPTLRPSHPRMLSQVQLARQTLPTTSMTYSGSFDDQPDGRQRSSSASLVAGLGRSSGEGESSSGWQRARATTALSDDPFPDLDPSTGLPVELSPRRRGSDVSDAPSLHLQRTITDLLSAPSKSSSSKSSFMPSLPNLSLPRVSLPSTPSFDFTGKGKGKDKEFSTTAAQDDWGTWATGWWSGNKGKVDTMMSDEDKADTVEEEKAKLRKKYRTPKNPIVFCHGLLGFDYLGPASLPPLQISHWRGIREVLESNGCEVLVARVPATSSVKDRAAILAEVISEKFPGREVNLIGHSMGGLDCRYLVSQIQPKTFNPVSLTTISSPHRGSPFADYLVDNVIGRSNLPSLLGMLEAMRLPQSGDGTAFSALGTHSMREFNAEVIDSPSVKYYSWGASFDPGLIDTFKWPHSIILGKEGANDGLVSVKSAKWGEYRGTLVGVNHLDLVGWVNTMRYAVAGWSGKPIAFKPATFYLEVADYLAEQGF